MALYGVWVQPITNDTTPANVQKYGEVQNITETYEQDTGNMSRDFCDGQTSPTAPRYADDIMGQLFFESEEAARYASSLLRSDIAARAAAGELSISIPGTWSAITVMPPGTVLSIIEAVREEIPNAVTDSQIENQISKYIEVNHNIPSPADLMEWLDEEAPELLYTL